MDDLIDTFANRLSYALTIRNIKPIELSEMTKIDKSKISSYMSGRYKAKTDGLKLIADALNVSPVWLMGYDVPMEREKDDKLSEQLKNIGTVYFSNSETVKIPLLGTVKAGYDYMAQENWIGNVDVDKDIIKDGNIYFALKVTGDSMIPTFVENDIVIVKKQSDFENGDIVVAIVNGDEATIKKGKKSEAGVLLQPLNPNYEPLIFTYDEMKTIPVVIVGIVKQLKRDF